MRDALVLGLVALLLFLGGWGLAGISSISTPAPVSSHPEATRSVADEARLCAAREGESAVERRERDDLCAQFRSALAAERTVQLAHTQMFLGVLESSILFLTLLAALGAVWISGVTARRQLRAYVSISKKELSGFDNKSDVKITLGFKNYGQTPAHELRWVFLVDFAPFSAFEDTVELERLVVDRSGSQDCVAPGDQRTAFYDLEMTKERWKDIEDRKLAIFAFGKIEYRDIFGELRTTTFRYFAGGPFGLDSPRLVIHPQGNLAL